MAIRFNPGDTRGAIVESEDYPFVATLVFNSSDLVCSCDLLGDVTVALPQNPVDRCQLEVFLTAIGADRSVTFGDAITMTQTADVDHGPFVIEQGTTLYFTLHYDGGRNLWFIPGLLAQY